MVRRHPVDVRWSPRRRDSGGNRHSRRQLGAADQSLVILDQSLVDVGQSFVVVGQYLVILDQSLVVVGQSVAAVGRRSSSAVVDGHVRPLPARGGAATKNSPVLRGCHQRQNHEVAGRDSSDPADCRQTSGTGARAGQLAWSGVGHSTCP